MGALSRRGGRVNIELDTENLHPRNRIVLEALHAEDHPVHPRDIAVPFGPQTVRRALGYLEMRGLVQRRLQYRPSGGRPAILFEAVSDPDPRAELERRLAAEHARHAEEVARLERARLERELQYVGGTV